MMVFGQKSAPVLRLQRRSSMQAHGAVSCAWGTAARRPDGHFKIPHLWPPKLLQAGRANYLCFECFMSG
jgi:hypothetical protein